MLPHWFPLLFLAIAENPTAALFVVQGSNALVLIMTDEPNCSTNASLGAERGCELVSR